VPPMDAPMDFSGWFEAYLGGAWYAFDARHNQPRIGRILIARGRDAADVAISTAFGSGSLESFRVWTDQLAYISAAIRKIAAVPGGLNHAHDADRHHST
jgi:transglutaminase-like putative cysteine protease